MSADQYRAKADALLKQASLAENHNERGRLIDEAVTWHNRALEAAGRPEPVLAIDDEGKGEGAVA